MKKVPYEEEMALCEYLVRNHHPSTCKHTERAIGKWAILYRFTVLSLLLGHLPSPPSPSPRAYPPVVSAADPSHPCPPICLLCPPPLSGDVPPPDLP